MKAGPSDCMDFQYYLRKNYNKTASLIARSCRAIAILGGSSSDVQDVAYEYGKNVGQAFQLIDDVLDFTGSESSLGKDLFSDLRQGLVTAPVLFAREEYPEM